MEAELEKVNKALEEEKAKTKKEPADMLESTEAEKDGV